MLNVSGHLLSTAEVESALVEHSAISEAAVVSHPHPVKGECLYCFVTLRDGHDFTKKLMDELKKQVREKIGPIATPDYIQNAPGLPKTRSGKIMRRVLRKIAKNDRELGDTSTVADPAVINHLFNNSNGQSLVCADIDVKSGSARAVVTSLQKVLGSSSLSSNPHVEAELLEQIF